VRDGGKKHSKKVPGGKWYAKFGFVLGVSSWKGEERGSR